jgi:hypothetical protein
MFTHTTQSPNDSRAPGDPFRIDNEVYNDTRITAAISTFPVGAFGTIFTLPVGRYILDYETSLGSAGSIGVWIASASGGPYTLNMDSIAGSSTATTWIYGKVLLNIVSQVYVFIGAAFATVAVVTAGDFAGIYMVRLNIIQVA